MAPLQFPAVMRTAAGAAPASWTWPASFAPQVFSQPILPWTWVFNIDMGKSPAPALEQAILDDVGTYGRQIGRIGEALEVLLQHVALERLDAKERAIIEDFQLQMAQVRRLKAQHGRP